MNLLKQIAFAAALTLAALWATNAEADDIKGGDLVIHMPWIKLSPGSSMASAYVTVTNNGKDDDKLMSVAIDGVPDSQLHQMKMEGEVIKMSEVKDGLAVPAGQTLQVWPKSQYHVMLMGMAKPFTAGDHIKGSLTFAKTGKVDVEFEVMKPGAMPGMKMN